MSVRGTRRARLSLRDDGRQQRLTRVSALRDKPQPLWRAPRSDRPSFGARVLTKWVLATGCRVCILCLNRPTNVGNALSDLCHSFESTNHSLSTPTTITRKSSPTTRLSRRSPCWRPTRWRRRSGLAGWFSGRSASSPRSQGHPRARVRTWQGRTRRGIAPWLSM